MINFPVIKLAALMGLSWVLVGVKGVFGQEAPQIKVLAHSGKVTFLGADGQYKPVFDGLPLKPASVIKVDGGYIALTYKAGVITKVVETADSGSYTPGILLNLSKLYTRPTTRYANLLIEHVRQADTVPPLPPLKAMTRFNQPLVYFPPPGYLLDKQQMFVWSRLDGVTPVEFILSGNNREVIERFTTTDTLRHLKIPFDWLQANTCFYLTLHNPQAESEEPTEICYKVHDKNSRQQIADTIKFLQNDLNPPANARTYVQQAFAQEYGCASATCMLVLASYYRSIQAHANAILAYRAAIKIAPDAKRYRKILESYLVELGFSPNARRYMMDIKIPRVPR